MRASRRISRGSRHDPLDIGASHAGRDAGAGAPSARRRRHPRPRLQSLPRPTAPVPGARGDPVFRLRARPWRAPADRCRGCARHVRHALVLRNAADAGGDRGHHRGRVRLRPHHPHRGDRHLLDAERRAHPGVGGSLPRARDHDRRRVPRWAARRAADLRRRSARCPRPGDPLDRAARDRRRADRGHAADGGRRARVRRRELHRARRHDLPRRIVARRARRGHARGRRPNDRARPFLEARGRPPLADPRHPAAPPRAAARALRPDLGAVHRRSLPGPDGASDRAAARELRREHRVGAHPVGGLHRVLLRPPRPQGGLRPSGGRGGAADVDLIRVLALALALWLTGAGVAYADTVTLDQYRVRLADARSLIDRSRTAGTADRVRLLAQARDLLRQTTTLRVGDETIAIDDAAVADLAGVPDGASRAIAILDTYISDALRGRRIDPAVADQRLREIVGPSASGGGGANPFAGLADAPPGWLNGAFSGLPGSAPGLSSLLWLLAPGGALARAPGLRVRALRRVHPLYWLALALLVASVVFTAATAKVPESVARTASVYDAGPGGAAALRRYLDVMGAATITLQGDAFDPDPARAGVLFVLAPAELVTTRDVDALRRYVESGGTLVFASDLSIFERSLSARLLEDLDVRMAGRLAPGTYDAGGIALADPPVHRIAIDQGATPTFGSGHGPLSAGTTSFAPLARAGRAH